VQASDYCYRWQVGRNGGECYELIPPGPEGERRLWFPGGSPWEDIFAGLATGETARFGLSVTKNGSFWTGDVAQFFTDYAAVVPEGAAGSAAVIPFVIDEHNAGLLCLRASARFFFTAREIEFYEVVAQMFGIAVADRRAQYALRERVKELTCLYGIARAGATAGTKLDEVLVGIVGLLPPAMQYPDHAFGRITLDDAVYETADYPADGPRLRVPLVIAGVERGALEVAYATSAPFFEAEPFLREEASLLEAAARQVSLIIERREAEESRERLQEQLRHADRLATIGQLAAGVAHELNEPLANILGYAQLVAKDEHVSEAVQRDVGKVVSAALHAREVVKKLLIFARQLPTRKATVNLNEVVNEGLFFLESRCSKEGINVVRDLDPALPPLSADAGQLQQVLVNLVVNAIQAMPAGGTLSITTRAEADGVVLSVADTGVGMSEDITKRIFLPFFTTKDVGQGTGLGLSVVHGIVSSHGGKIDVRSAPGKGSVFEVYFPLRSAEEDRG